MKRLTVQRDHWSFVRRLAVAGIGLALLWQVITNTFTAYLAETRPELALRLRADYPLALMTLAQRKLDAEFGGGVVAPQARARLVPNDANTAAARGDAFGGIGAFASAARIAVDAQRANEGGPVSAQAASVGKPLIALMPPAPEAPPTPAPIALVGLSADQLASLAQINSRVRLALKGDPLNSHAYRILGQAASLAGDDEGAEPLMAAAAKHSLHESIAVHWLMRRAIDTQDYARAASYVDTLLRTRPQLRDVVLPSLVQIAESPQGSGVIKELLANNPPWRSGLFPVLSLFVTDARTPLALFLHLKTTKVPPTVAEVQPYVDFLVARRFYELAYDTWLQFLPDGQLAAAGNLFNSQFQFPLSGMPFDWRIAAKAGVRVEVEPLPEGGDQRALSLEFRTGQVDFGGVTQTVLLRPGSYQFKGRHTGTLVGRRGVKWRVACLDTPATAIGESAMFVGVSKTWEAFSFGFTVPASGCGAQIVRLDLDARSASERLVTGTMLFTDLDLVTVEGAAGEVKDGK